jgi:hypothetical protein
MANKKPKEVKRTYAGRVGPGAGLDSSKIPNMGDRQKEMDAHMRANKKRKR